MFKKLLCAAALCASSSFAFWDVFPVLEDHHGETSAGVSFEKQGKNMELFPYIGTRYTILPNLELALTIPYFINLTGNNDNGVLNPIFTARYQFIPSMNVFLDIRIPSTESLYSSTAWGFCLGAQYSQKVSIVNFGAYVGLSVQTDGDEQISPPLGLDFGFETKFEFGFPIVPFIGAGAMMEIGKYSEDGHHIGNSHTGHLLVTPIAGLQFNINESFNIEASANTTLGKKDHLGGHTPIGTNIEFNMKF